MPPLLKIPELEVDPRLAVGFSTVGFGSMGPTRDVEVAAVRASRQAFAGALGIDPAAITALGAVHSAVVARVDVAQRQVSDVDGLVTDQPGLALFATFADCYPLVAYDPVRNAVGLAHAGWRGTAAGIAARLVEALASAYGSSPSDLRVGIGPGICGRCYEVGPEFADRFPAGVIRPGCGDRLLLDLAAANRLQFRAAGVPAAQIAMSGSCTLESKDLFSHRRQSDGTRFAALVALR